MGALEKLGDAIDSAIAIFSPQAYQRRLQYRTAAFHQKRYYEGATKGRRAEAWRKVDNSEREPYEQLLLLRNRSRDFSRNNGYAKKAVGGIVSNAIGTGIISQYKSPRFAKRAEKNNAAWKAWHDSKAIDFNGMLTGPALQELAFRTMVESGEVFIRRRMVSVKTPRGEVTKLKLQVLEPEYLNESLDSGLSAVGARIVKGIEYDASDVRTYYHFYKAHPADRGNTETVKVPADEVIHLYRKNRPDQQRGIPWGHAAMLNLKDLDGYEDSELVRRKVASCFAAFVSRNEVEVGANINGSLGPGQELPPLIDRMEPGIIEHLGPGESITTTAPPNVTGYSEYVQQVLHKIASAYEVPYSVLTGDFSLVNFSSGRMGWLEFQRVLEQWRWNLFIPSYMDTIKLWFETIGTLQGLNFNDMDHEWTAPRREMIDPLKEITAKVMQVKAGLISMQEAIKEMGYDPETNVAEITAWNALIDASGIILDSDPRKDPKRMIAQNVALGIKMKDNLDKESEE